MNVLFLQIFISLTLVASAVAFFVYVVRSRTLEHSDRLSLAPLDDDAPPVSPSAVEHRTPEK